MFLQKYNKTILLLSFILITTSLLAEDGYRLWLRYNRITNQEKIKQYDKQIKSLLIEGNSPQINAATNELQLGLAGLLGKSIPATPSLKSDATLIVGKLPGSLLLNEWPGVKAKTERLGEEGYIIETTTLKGKKVTVITAQTDVGVLYGVFHFLRLLQSEQNIQSLSIESVPKTKVRILNHWDNLDRTVERGYAGFSIWDWHKLPDFIDPRYVDYARANASIGINGTVVTNVNANSLILTPAYLQKVKALADVFRPYGIKIYLTARFSSPIEIGGLKTADPLDPDVKQWWKGKATEIYSLIPDFGGFLVKANSEGQPGPQNYGRSHAEGANLLAEAVAPHNGIVMWRAFVYDNEVPEDRHKQAYSEFKPLDGSLLPNVMVQVKNGAIDFQPREPFHPLFGAMPKTPLMMEFQITQEYLGFATHLVYLASLFKEVLDSDTHAKGQGSTVANVIDGSLDNHSLSGIAGVANIGNDRNWCGHPFGQANWYSFGRLAWNHELTPEQIADEWIRMTFSNDPNVVRSVTGILMSSHETTVNYMTPLGLHHIMGYNHHYGPGPWVQESHRADWNSVYYHKADSIGIGFNRTTSGSNAVGQYFPPVRDMFNNVSTCPEKYLLWFHHLPWDYKMKSGRTLWDEMCYKYSEGVESVRKMQEGWNSMKEMIDDERFEHVKMFLTIQEKEAVQWRNSCVLYFQTFSKRPIPKDLEKPEHDLEYYKKLSYPYAPGIRPRW